MVDEAGESLNNTSTIYKRNCKCEKMYYAFIRVFFFFGCTGNVYVMLTVIMFLLIWVQLFSWFNWRRTFML